MGSSNVLYVLIHRLKLSNEAWLLCRLVVLKLLAFQSDLPPGPFAKAIQMNSLPSSIIAYRKLMRPP